MPHSVLSAPRFRFDLGVAIRAFYQASPRLTIATLVVATLLGLLQPAFVVATGFVVEAAATGASIVLPLSLLAVVFTASRVLGPIRDELGLALWRRVDQSMGDRIMRAISGQPGLEHVEDPRVQDLVVQAEGTLTGFSVGQAAQLLGLLWSQRIFGFVSLLIIFRTYWWSALLLGIVHTLGYAGARWHWDEVTQVIIGRTDQLRHAFYLRGLALSRKQQLKLVCLVSPGGWWIVTETAHTQSCAASWTPAERAGCSAPRSQRCLLGPRR